MGMATETRSLLFRAPTDPVWYYAVLSSSFPFSGLESISQLLSKNFQLPLRNIQVRHSVSPASRSGH
ncbi:hypothetical protein DPMN_099934 [Dreissena polymorpha]|uniref:Uncharacterized protein n=1 Tax=Dreissena polymorpha TaxID=45954 RepID=A0A9D4R859_DREPO|nr:hypothetical protein DPMN_099934 [Dreissena polymorpha]